VAANKMRLLKQVVVHFTPHQGTVDKNQVRHILHQIGALHYLSAQGSHYSLSNSRYGKPISIRIAAYTRLLTKPGMHFAQSTLAN
jgi:hypothetical protein